MHEVVESLGVLVWGDGGDAVALEDALETVLHLFAGVEQGEDVDYAYHVLLVVVTGLVDVFEGDVELLGLAYQLGSSHATPRVFGYSHQQTIIDYVVTGEELTIAVDGS